MLSKTYGLVLAGGGAKGAYEMGAWKALREMRINFSSIAGVSIGAINGALIAADKYKEALYLWDNLSLEKGVKTENPLPDPDNLFSSKNYRALFFEFLKNGGIDASPMGEILGQYIDEEAVRKSGIPYGLLTYSVSSLKPVELFIEDIPEGRMLDYILASAKYPGVSNIGPKDETFIDGGTWDNAPISMLRKRGVNKFIVIDISNIRGVAHRDDLTNAEVVYIKPHNLDELGASFDFNEELLKKRSLMGYLDTKKAFGKISGNIYYFKPYVFRNLIQHYTPDGVYQLENLAYSLGLPTLTIYKEKDFMRSLKDLYEKEKERQAQEEKEKGKDREKEKEEEKKKEKSPGFFSSLIKKLPIFNNEPKQDYTLAFKILEEYK